MSANFPDVQGGITRSIVILCAVLGFSRAALAVEYRLFANADAYYAENQENDGSFMQGTVAFFLTESLSDRVDVLSEVTIHPHNDKLAGVDLERLQIGYLINDSLRFWFGRFHSIMGYWNETYHHGLLLHSSIERPGFLNWEHDGGIIPTHMNGLWFDGKADLDPVRFDYGLMIGNGESLTDAGMWPGSTRDDNRNKAITLNLTARLKSYPFAGIGVSGMSSTMDIEHSHDAETDTTASGTTLSRHAASGEVAESADSGIAETDQTILGLHFFHAPNAEWPIELLAEAYTVEDEDVTIGQTYDSDMFFVQAGYAVNEKILPYVRYEKVEADEGSPYISGIMEYVKSALSTGVNPAAQDHSKIIVGLRYNVTVKNAIKFEVRNIDVPGASNPDDRDFWEAGFQWAFSL